MERNLQLYPIYCAARSLVFWLPVFFLYFSSVLSVSEVLILEAIYYAGVVVLEVPSGYLSDRVGRRITLMGAMAAWSAACFVFAATGSFWPFATAQLLLAVGMAFNSGTDTSMLYDSLDSIGRSQEFADREARAQSAAFAAMAVAALLGGAWAGFDLRVAYVLSGIGGAIALAIATAFTEPKSAESAGSPLIQLASVRSLSRNPTLRWMFVFAVGMTVLNHVPYELFQPWVSLYLADMGQGYSPTPAATGTLMAVMMAFSALASAQAITLRDRLGVTGVLIGATLWQAAVTASLAAPAHFTVLALLALRSVPRGVAGPVTNAAIHPHLDSSVRATWLSVQSLAGRLAFSGALAAASVWTAGAGMTFELIADLATAAAFLGVLLAVILTLLRPQELRQTR